MSNAAKNEVLSSFRETINNSLAEMDDRKLKHLFTPFLQHVLALELPIISKWIKTLYY